jgi:nitrite reductase/ring-hydroxylating ferredoxin subunit
LIEHNGCEGLCESRPHAEITEVPLGVSRRNALKGVAALFAAVGLTSASTAAFAAAKTYKVCKTTDIKIGSAKIFAVNGLPVVITQPKKGVFKAFNGYCTHQGAPLAASVGAVATQGTNMFCFQHGASFNTTTGSATGGPANRPLAKITAKVAGTQVSVTL